MKLKTSYRRILFDGFLVLGTNFAIKVDARCEAVRLGRLFSEFILTATIGPATVADCVRDCCRGDGHLWPCARQICALNHSTRHTTQLNAPVARLRFKSFSKQINEDLLIIIRSVFEIMG